MNKLPAYILSALFLAFAIGILGAAEAQIQFSDAAKVYNGSPQAISVQTIPAGLEVEVTYNGSAEPPTNAGNYSVTSARQRALTPGRVSVPRLTQISTPACVHPNNAHTTFAIRLLAFPLQADHRHPEVPQSFAKVRDARNFWTCSTLSVKSEYSHEAPRKHPK